MADLHHLTAVEQLDALGRRELSPVELTEHYLRRIERHDATLGAFITVTADLALGEARAAERRLRDDGGARPPLLGLPVPIKDLHTTAGVRTTFGSKAFAGFVPDADSWTVGLIRGAGAVLLGKTNAPEFGPTCYTENDLGVGPAVTPYDITRYASGSSGGAAAAVAAGLAPLAHGSDGAGSVRTPAGACGLIGYKPSRGAVSLYPGVSFASFGVEGPIARTIEDAALLGDVMLAPPPAEIWPDPTPDGAPSLREAVLHPRSRPLRIACWTGTGVEGVEPHPAAVEGVRRAAGLLARQGHDVAEINPPAIYDDTFVQAILLQFAGGISAVVKPLVPRERWDVFRPLTRRLLELGAASDAGDATLAEATLAVFAGTVRAKLAPYDLALCPTTSGPPVPVGWFSECGFEIEAQRMIGWSCGTPFANATGHCAVSLPLAWTGEGLPIGVQLAMPPGRDAELFSTAAVVLGMTDAWQRHPPQFDE
jgi:amidase